MLEGKRDHERWGEGEGGETEGVRQGTYPHGSLHFSTPVVRHASLQSSEVVVHLVLHTGTAASHAFGVNLITKYARNA